MSPTTTVLVCVLMWGISTFLNKLAVEQMPAFLMQITAGFIYIIFMPTAYLFVMNKGYKWSSYGIALTLIATAISVSANILLYMSMKGNSNAGASTMLVSLYPVITLFLSILLLHEQITLYKVLGTIAMIIGTVFLCM